MTIYYNEIDKDACAQLSELMRRGLIAPGDIDDRSIDLVQPGDVAGYTQCHFFAGIGVWSHAARLAGWPDERPLWTGSCPCQPFSVSGKRRGTADRRHLWPHLFRLISACRPPVVMGEQVAQSLGWNWFDGVSADLAGAAYQCRGFGLCSCAVDSPDERERIYWGAVADGKSECWQGERTGRAGSGRREQPTGGYDAIRSHRALADDQGIGRGSGLCQDGSFGDGNIPANGHGYDTLVNGAGERRGEGRSEPILRCGRDATTGTDARGGEVVDDIERGRQAGGSRSPERGNSASSPDAPSSQMVDRESERRGEGLPERLVQRSDDATLADPDAPGLTLGDRDGQGLSIGRCLAGDAREERPPAERTDGAAKRNGSWYADHEWIVCHDGKARRAQPSTPMLVARFAGRIPLWRGLGGSINAQLAKEVIMAFMDVYP